MPTTNSYIVGTVASELTYSFSCESLLRSLNSPKSSLTFSRGYLFLINSANSRFLFATTFSDICSISETPNSSLTEAVILSISSLEYNKISAKEVIEQ